ncbi:MAG TPA: family 43 glycosylhydrolase, partial [Puia sp.]
SCIGLAVNKTLDIRSRDFRWEDAGKVVQSVPGRDNWNAIDPNLALDADGRPWLAFGSFWGGIKLVRLTEDLRSVAQPEEWHTIADRQRNAAAGGTVWDAGTADTSAGDAAIEAPFIFKRGKWYYLFVSWDYCCRAEKSTYKMAVGRSGRIEGPYLDKTGKAMTAGGGSLVLEGDADWFGVGHNAVVHDDDGDWLIFHGYDAHDKGRSKLRIRKLSWVEDWPTL